MTVTFLPGEDTGEDEYSGGTFAPPPPKPIPPMPEIPKPPQIPPMPEIGEEREPEPPPMPEIGETRIEEPIEIAEEDRNAVDRELRTAKLELEVASLRRLLLNQKQSETPKFQDAGKLDDSVDMPGMPFDKYLDSGETENDHSFHFAPTGTGAGTVTDGFYRIGDGSGVEITPAALTDTTTRWYWVKVDWTGETPEVSWDDNDTGFPTTVDDIWIYPIFEFDSDGVCIEHRQTDIQLPTYSCPRCMQSLFDTPVLRAYLKADDTLVAPTIAYNASTMYLYWTWDYVRVMA